MTSTHEAARSEGVATPQTPFIKNAWYVAALASEVTTAPLRRALLGQEVVLFRTTDGKAVALQNRCPHRGVPMHLGTVKGDRIVCAYHGMEFDTTGQCTLIPTSDAPPPAAMKLQRYPLVETGPLLWIWMGDPAKADPGLIPDCQWLVDPQWDQVHGSRLDLKASYLRMHENLSDLSHFPFLHSAHNVGNIEYAKRKIHMESDETHLKFWWEFDISEVTELRLAHLGILGRHVYRRDDDVVLPGVRVGNSVYKVLDAKPGERTLYRSALYHLLTPSTQNSCHYFWVMGFDAPFPAGTKPAMTKKITEVFEEDVTACEGIESVAWEDRPEFRFTLIPMDWTVVQTGRYLLRLSQREQAERGKPAAAAA